MVYKKVRGGVGPRGGVSTYKHLLSSPHERNTQPHNHNKTLDLFFKRRSETFLQGTHRSFDNSVSKVNVLEDGEGSGTLYHPS